MKYFYLELDSGKIASIGEVTSVDAALKATIGLLVELTEQEHALLSACKGDVDRGSFLLQGIKIKVSKAMDGAS